MNEEMNEKIQKIMYIAYIYQIYYPRKWRRVQMMYVTNKRCVENYFQHVLQLASGRKRLELPLKVK